MPRRCKTGRHGIRREMDNAVEVSGVKPDWPGESAVGVRRDKAAFSSGCKPPPGNRSGRKHPEQPWG
jgi:hypothetical protein